MSTLIFCYAYKLPVGPSNERVGIFLDCLPGDKSLTLSSQLALLKLILFEVVCWPT